MAARATPGTTAARYGAILRKFRADEIALREQTRAHLKGVLRTGDNVPIVLRDWWSRHRENIKDWARDHFRDRRHELELPDDETVWPAFENLSALWNGYSFAMALIYLNVGENRAIRASDDVDRHHYVAASYTDVLVTDDDDFRRTCEMIPTTSFQIQSFDEFVRQHLGVSWP